MGVAAEFPTDRLHPFQLPTAIGVLIPLFQFDYIFLPRSNPLELIHDIRMLKISESYPPGRVDKAAKRGGMEMEIEIPA